MNEETTHRVRTALPEPTVGPHKGNYGFGFDAKRLHGRLRGPGKQGKYNRVTRGQKDAAGKKSSPLTYWSAHAWQRRCAGMRAILESSR